MNNAVLRRLHGIRHIRPLRLSEMLVYLPPKKVKKPKPEVVHADLTYRGVRYTKDCVVNSMQSGPWLVS